jgi:4-amino-4-deoxy-L-arabinose transferase-like glycosyltransferase
MFFSRRARWAVLLPLAAYLGISVWALGRMGLYYDEMLFVNAALGRPAGNLFVSLEWHGVPLMLMPYIGALKAWIYYPVFKIFGVTALSVRLPVILMGASAIWFTYEYVRRLFSPSAGWIAASLLAVDPSFIFHTRWDWGPTALMMLLKSLFLVGVCEWLRTGRAWPCWLALGAAALGVFDKLNFIWVAVATGLSVLIVYPRQVREIVRRDRLNAALFLGAVVAMLTTFLIYQQTHLPKNSWISPSQMQARSAEVLRLLRISMGGAGPYFFIFAREILSASAHVVALGMASLLAVCAAASGLRSGSNLRSLIFLTLLGMFIFLQLFVTREATGSHHMMMLCPVQLALLAGLTSTAFQTQRRVSSILAAVALLAVVITSLRVDLDYLKSPAQSVRNPNWDRGSYALAGFAQQHRQQRFICVDWGIGTVLLGLTQGKVECRDYWPTFMSPLPVSQAEWIEREFANTNTIFVLHAAGAEVFSQTRSNFFALASDRQWHLDLIGSLPRSDGQMFIEFYTAHE